MLHTVTARTLAIAACGWLLAWDAAALTLGRAHGAPLIGRPLELSIPVTLDAPEAEAPCASADVFYGESRVGRTPSVRWEAGAGAQGVLHVSSSQPVDEPMVTLYLRVGCGQSTTRRFVLLSEPPPANEPSVAAPRALPVQPPLVAAPTAPSAPRQAARGNPQVVPRAPATATPHADAAPAAPAAPAAKPRESVARSGTELRATPELAAPRRAGKPVRPAPAQRAKKPEAGTSTSRLKLEPLDLSIDRDPTLRLSTELQSQVASNPQQRAAAAALWAALQKSPDEALQDSVRLKGLEHDLASLRETTRQNASAVGQMRAQVEQARGNRDTAALLVLVLSALLAALLGWLAWRWYRVHQLERVGRWFEQHGESAQGPLADRTVGAASEYATPVDVPLPHGEAAPAATASRIAGKTVAAVEGHGATATLAPAPAAAIPGSAWGSGGEFQASRGAAMRTVGVAELIDVHDKADFFLSIGESDQAVAVLEAHVHDQVETSALAWMDLLELYHSLGKRLEYERLRSEFCQRFTAQVPDFEHFDQPTASLENYSRALSRIVALWPSHRVLDVIEESIFRRPGLPGGDPFSLEAYRELVLLYHVARDITPEEPAAQKPAARAGFADTLLQPLNVLDAADSTLDTRPAPNDMLLVPPASSRIGVDIDLTSLAPDTGASTAAGADELDFDLPPVDVAAAAPPAPPPAAEEPRVHAAAPVPAQPGARGLAAADGSRELPPLDFDISASDGLPEEPRRKHGS